MILFDQNGNQAGQTSISGGEQYLSIPVSTLVQTDLPMARAQINVNTGRLTACGVRSVRMGQAQPIPAAKASGICLPTAKS